MATQDAKRAKLEADGEPMAVDDNDTHTARDSGALLAGLSLNDKMRIYYSKLFPTQQMYKWLVYGNDARHAAVDASFFTRRELCFTLDGDIFVRYQSFQNAVELRSALVSRVPSKIDIGPVYNHDPRQRAKYAKDFRPVQRELVFDVDLTDYDDVRTCGQGGHICSRCWPLMAAAVVVVDAALRQDFGFRSLLWVYSGRRGVHCWVSDERARTMGDEVRSALVSYLSVYKGVEGDRVKLGMGATRHPAVERAYQALLPAWREHILPSQRLLEEPASIAKLLRYIPDEELTEQLRRGWASSSGGGDDVSVRRWDELVREVEARAARLAKGQRGRSAAMLKGLADAVFSVAYPRLDVEVSKRMNHLLKAPFCVHPKTGKVCVPIDPEAVWDFDPDAVPQLDELLTELGSDGIRGAANEEAWRDTSLAPAIALFEGGFLAPLAAEQRRSLNTKAREAVEQRRAATVPMTDLSW